MEAQHKAKFGYWGVRGAGQVIRFLLGYTKTPFEDVLYSAREKWFDEDKKNLGFDFPNLPYLIDGDFKLTESTAIMHYVINKSGHKDLLGKTLMDTAEVNRLIGVIGDAFKEVRGLVWNKEYDTAKGAVLYKIKGKLNDLQTYLGQKHFFLGYVTLADFLVAEHSYYFEALFPNEFKKYSFMKKIRHHFNHLPEIKEYLAREDSFKGPFLPPGYTTLVIEAKSDTCEEHHDNAHEKKEHHHHCAVLGYWGIRGLGQIPRLLLSHFKVEFKDKKYLSKEEWFDQDKTALGLTFANLPYYIDHDVRLTESSAINKYLIEKYDKTLLGKDVKDSAIVDEILGVLKDGVTDIVSLFFNPEHEKAKTAVLEKSKTKFEYLQKFIGEKNHALGYLTLTDFVIAENAYYVEKIFPEEYKTWPFFNNIRKAVNYLPGVVEYYSKETAVKGPFLPVFVPLPF